MASRTDPDIQIKRISERVWNITDTVYSDIETLMNAGFFDGKSAEQIAIELKQYLKNPQLLSPEEIDKLVAEGEISFSQGNKLKQNMYKALPQGVYRSAFKNAFRLARNEINIAYHRRDYDNRQRLPFVVGIEVVLSSEHSFRMPQGDMCDDLQGNYPRDFQFSGWHVQCMCSTRSILANDTQMRAFFQDKNPQFKYVNDIPKSGQNWIKDNSETINKAKSKPYWIVDNKIKT